MIELEACKLPSLASELDYEGTFAMPLQQFRKNSGSKRDLCGNTAKKVVLGDIFCEPGPFDLYAVLMLYSYHVYAVIWPCSRYVQAVSVPCSYHIHVSLMCSCYVQAVLIPCSYHVHVVSLACLCHESDIVSNKITPIKLTPPIIISVISRQPQS